MATADSIDEYIAGFPDEARKALEQVRGVVRDAAPEAVETISYAIPTYDLQGKHLVHFAGYRRHIGFYPTSSGIRAFADEIEGYKRTTGAVQFPLTQPMPADLIRRIVLFRLDEERERAK